MLLCLIARGVPEKTFLDMVDIEIQDIEKARVNQTSAYDLIKKDPSSFWQHHLPGEE